MGKRGDGEEVSGEGRGKNRLEKRGKRRNRVGEGREDGRKEER